jgi:hypothetical protein
MGRKVLREISKPQYRMMFLLTASGRKSKNDLKCTLKRIFRPQLWGVSQKCK